MWVCPQDEPRWLAPAGPREVRQARAVAFGVAAPSAVERAVGFPAGAPEFGPRLAAELEQFVDCRWPHRYLTQPDPAGTG